MNQSHLIYNDEYQTIICLTCGHGLSPKLDSLKYHISQMHQIKGALLQETLEELQTYTLLDKECLVFPVARNVPILGLNVVPGFRCTWPACNKRPFREKRKALRHVITVHGMHAKKAQEHVGRAHIQSLFTKPQPTYFVVGISSLPTSMGQPVVNRQEASQSQFESQANQKYRSKQHSEQVICHQLRT
jgi:hypothetical protein